MSFSPQYLTLGESLIKKKVRVNTAIIASRFTVTLIFFLCSCAHSQQLKNVEIKSNVEGCFSFKVLSFDMNKELLLLVAEIKSATANSDCPCKSAIMKYTASQKRDGEISNLLSGQFSVLGKEKITLPIAVQKELVFKDSPIQISLSCYYVFELK